MKQIILVLAFMFFLFPVQVFAGHIVQPVLPKGRALGLMYGKTASKNLPCGLYAGKEYSSGWTIYKLSGKILLLINVVSSGGDGFLKAWLDKDFDGHFDEYYEGSYSGLEKKLVERYTTQCDVFKKTVPN
jgi:hypothetical protein